MVRPNPETPITHDRAVRLTEDVLREVRPEESLEPRVPPSPITIDAGMISLHAHEGT